MKVNTMEDTAQPMAAETPLDDQIDSAAQAIRAMRTVNQPRDLHGRFAGDEPEEAPPEEDAEQPEHEEEYDEEEHEAEGPDEDQPEAVEMPKSWSKEDADLWQTLPPSAQAKIAEREGQRAAAINSKFQEAANARKEFEAKLAEASAGRDKWAQDYDLLVADLSLPKPDPRQYGLGTQHYNRDAYDIAMLQWEEGSSKLDALKQQRQEIAAQQEQEERTAWTARKNEINSVYEPQLLALMPELQDPQKAVPAVQELVKWGIEQGLQPEQFSADNSDYITAAEMRILALAKQAFEAQGSAKKAPPKMQPAIRPGVATPRAAQKTVARKKAFDRLASENSIEAAVAAMRAARR